MLDEEGNEFAAAALCWEVDWRMDVKPSSGCDQRCMGSQLRVTKDVFGISLYR